MHQKEHVIVQNEKREERKRQMLGCWEAKLALVRLLFVQVHFKETVHLKI